MAQFQVRKDDFATSRVVSTPTENAGDGEIKVRINHFAFTANNITYAAAGDMLGYWQFFPPAGEETQGWGVIPVWGFAEVVESTLESVLIGDRLFGYFPRADELIMLPENVSEARFIDGAKHRAGLPAGYNMYRRVNAEPGYDASLDNERMLLWTLFITSYCLWDSLQFKHWYGAQQVIVPSASSKTSVGMAYALQADPNAPSVIGVTSSRNLAFVEKLGLYDTCLSYDDLKKLDSTLQTVIVDMSGNTKVLGYSMTKQRPLLRLPWSRVGVGSLSQR